jgi:type I restriction enzyme S subunit
MSFGESLDVLINNSTDGLLAAHPSWARVKLGEISTLTNGYPFNSAGFNTEIGEPLVRIRDISRGRPETLYKGNLSDPKIPYIANGHIVIGMDGDFNCRVWQGGRALLNQRVCTVCADEAVYSQKLLAFALPGYLKVINDNTSSITVKHLSSKTVQDIPLPLPPLPEQRRIVERIETLFARLDKGEEAVRQVQGLLRRYRQSVLKAAVTGDIIGKTADAWPETTLGRHLQDMRYGTAKKCLPTPHGTAVLRIPNVVGGEIDLQDLKYTDLRPKDLKTLSLKKGDMLIVRSNGSANLVGRGAVVNDDGVGLAFAGYLIRLRLNQNQLLPDYLQLVLGAPAARSAIERQARSTSGVHNINSDEVRAISFRLPSLPDQAAIVAVTESELTKVDDLESWCATELARSTALRQSILKQAFSGRLVPQDPTDEPAAALLARIRATRLTQQPRKRG